MLPIEIRAFRMVPKGLEKKLENWELEEESSGPQIENNKKANR